MNEIIKNLPSYLIRKAGGNYAETRFLFKTPASDGPIFVRGNRRSLISMVSNLVANAVKYAGNDGLASFDVYEKQNVIGDQAAKPQHLYAQEFGRRQNRPVPSNEFGPGR